MHPLLNQHVARLHREELYAEAAIERSLAQLNHQENVSNFNQHLSFFQSLHNQTMIMYERPVVIKQVKYNDINFDEIKSELKMTLSALREAEPEYDDYRIESFVQKLRNKLPPEGEFLLVERSTTGHRLILAVAFLCVLMPLIGMMIGINQGILVGVSLLCLAVVALSGIVEPVQ